MSAPDFYLSYSTEILVCVIESVNKFFIFETNWWQGNDDSWKEGEEFNAKVRKEYEEYDPNVANLNRDPNDYKRDEGAWTPRDKYWTKHETLENIKKRGGGEDINMFHSWDKDKKTDKDKKDNKAGIFISSLFKLPRIVLNSKITFLGRYLMSTGWYSYSGC